jgi:hypothetical protein
MAENPEIFHNFDPKYVSLGAEEPAAEFFILRQVLLYPARSCRSFFGAY